MRRLANSTSSKAPLIIGVLASGLYALVVWLTDDDPLKAHTLEIVAMGITFFFSTLFARRKSAERSSDERD
jgi:hypothetical protein